jgi:phage gp29-like protein
VDDEPVLSVAPPPAASGAAALRGQAALKAADSAATDTPPLDPVADHTERMLEDAAPAWGDVLDKLREIVQSATSWKDLEAKLEGAFAALPSDKLVKVLEMGFAAADLAGRFEVMQGR